tara:strand:+ start:338 stop:1048 length:711 start_codon:yes stop_codon:yes gene_type:complete
MKIAAIIPARAGSVRFKDKNISLFAGKPLFYHSIYFAKKLKFISEIIFTSDSEKYKKIAKKISNITIHDRNKKASISSAMEEDVLEDIRKNFTKQKKALPDAVLWLRPTSPLRCLETFETAYRLFKKTKKTVLVVHKEEPRLFYLGNNKYIKPINPKMKKKSMLRGQECKPLLSIFSGEIFMYPKKYKKDFLGNQKLHVVAPKYTKYDIDNEDDLKILNAMNIKKMTILKKFIHIK